MTRPRTVTIPSGLMAAVSAAATRLHDPRAQAKLGLTEPPTTDEVVLVALRLGLEVIEDETRPG